MKITAEERDFILRHRCEADSREECFEKIEQHLFGDQFGQPEPNTDDENRLFTILEAFVRGDFMEDELPNQVTEAFDFLKECEPYYSKMLTPKAKAMYRGIRVPNIDKTMLNLMNKKPIGLTKGRSKNKQYTFVRVKSNYRPVKQLESWTTDIDVAAVFAKIKFTLKKVLNGSLKIPAKRTPSLLPLIVKVKTDDSFFGSPKLSNKISEKTIGKHEHEVFRMGGKIKCEALIEKTIYDYIKDRI